MRWYNSVTSGYNTNSASFAPAANWLGNRVFVKFRLKSVKNSRAVTCHLVGGAKRKHAAGRVGALHHCHVVEVHLYGVGRVSGRHRGAEQRVLNHHVLERDVQIEMSSLNATQVD